jgi:hypothetical protein
MKTPLHNEFQKLSHEDERRYRLLMEVVRSIHESKKKQSFLEALERRWRLRKQGVEAAKWK